MHLMTYATVSEIYSYGNLGPAALSGGLRRLLSPRRELRTPFFWRPGGAGMADPIRPPVYISCVFRRSVQREVPTYCRFLTFSPYLNSLTGEEQAGVRLLAHCSQCQGLPSFHPTATSRFDLRADTRYAPPAYPMEHQEAPYVTSLSDRR